ncbi:MAG: PIG-L family deacetylase [Verrucomicrobiae bacterium]|nr:PIG-L family deacetylase [Verrucomicrobiae bacterium]
MKFSNPHADLLIPDGTPLPQALERTTHMGIGAHQDDLEFMCFHGILECHQKTDRWFAGVTVTSGSGSSRTGPYREVSDQKLVEIRREEQRRAAVIGEYGAMIQLGYDSATIKDPLGARTRLVPELVEIIRIARPRVIYTHNPADKHPSHIAVVLPLIEALRRLPQEMRPEKLYGCEGWRNLDWMPDTEKVVLNVGGNEPLLRRLMSVFDSQIAGGKHYDLATLGRKQANATYFQSHASDQAALAEFAMDLTPLLRDDTLSVEDFTLGFIDRFRNDVLQTLRKQTG